MKASFFFLLWSCSLILSSCVHGQTVDPNTFEKGLTADVQILDVRTPLEYQQGHISNAMLANIEDDEAEFTRRIDALNREKPVYVYCLAGGRSRNAVGILKEKGFTNIVELDGGINAWRKAGKPLEGKSKVRAITPKAYGKIINSARLVLVDFGAPWCPPCRKMAPIIDRLEKDYSGKLTVVKIDGGSQADLMKAQNVSNMPTFVLYNNGTEVWRGAGILDGADLDKQITPFLAK